MEGCARLASLPGVFLFGGGVMRVLATLVLGLVFAAPGFAQERAFLSKDDVDKMVRGKKVTHLRHADNAKVLWELGANGSLNAANLSRGSSDSGNWALNDAGQICVTWRGRSEPRCVALARAGDKTVMVDSRDLKAAAYADVLPD
jgi:hypothetical protein